MPVRSVGSCLCFILLSGLCLGPSLAFGFRITAPQDGVVLHSGQEVPVTVDLGTEIGVRWVQYYWYRTGEEPLVHQQATPALEATSAGHPPYGGRLRVPVEAIGRMRLLAVGDVTRGRLAGQKEFDEIIIQVDPTAELAAIEFGVEKPWHLDTLGKIVEIPVVGQFADGVTRRLDGISTGSTYGSSNEKVIKMHPGGLAQIVGNGRATITVTNRGRTGTLEVVVKSDAEFNRSPIAHAGPELTVKAGATVILDASQSADPDGDPLQYEWSQVRGNKVSLLDQDSPRATFVAPKVSKKRLLRFKLRVTDMTGPDTVKGADSLPSFVNVWIEP
jgi:hypothetical protein